MAKKKDRNPIIDDCVDHDLIYPVGVGRGYEPRNWDTHPQTMYAQPDEMGLIPESEWDARFEEQEKEQSSLEHMFFRDGSNKPAFINLDQNGHGYCWAYSVGSCMMMDRVKTNSPVPRLNPHSVAAIVKNGRDEGGWCGLSQMTYESMGCAVEGTGPGQWPLHSRDLRHNTPDMREQAKKNRWAEGWVDLSKQVYDRNLTIRQLATALFNNQPCAVDFDWWGHSVCAIRWVRIEKGSWGPLILNSWFGWGRHGLGQLQGQKGVPMGAVSLRSSVAA